jgi:hypothetical protein
MQTRRGNILKSLASNNITESVRLKRWLLKNTEFFERFCVHMYLIEWMERVVEPMKIKDFMERMYRIRFRYEL